MVGYNLARATANTWLLVIASTASCVRSLTTSIDFACGARTGRGSSIDLRSQRQCAVRQSHERERAVLARESGAACDDGSAPARCGAQRRELAVPHAADDSHAAEERGRAAWRVCSAESARAQEPSMLSALHRDERVLELRPAAVHLRERREQRVEPSPSPSPSPSLNEEAMRR